MKWIHYYILLGLSILILSSCIEIKEYCKGLVPGELPIMTFDDNYKGDTINCCFTTIDTIWGDINFRIDNQYDFESIFSCEKEYPKNNFQDYTLLTGYKGTLRKMWFLDQRVIVTCTRNVPYEEEELFVVYNVRLSYIPDTIYSEYSIVPYHAFIPKLPKDIPIIYVIQKYRATKSEALKFR